MTVSYHVVDDPGPTRIPARDEFTLHLFFAGSTIIAPYIVMVDLIFKQHMKTCPGTLKSKGVKFPE